MQNMAGYAYVVNDFFQPIITSTFAPNNIEIEFVFIKNRS